MKSRIQLAITSVLLSFSLLLGFQQASESRTSKSDSDKTGKLEKAKKHHKGSHKDSRDDDDDSKKSSNRSGAGEPPALPGQYDARGNTPSTSSTSRQHASSRSATSHDEQTRPSDNTAAPRVSEGDAGSTGTTSPIAGDDGYNGSNGSNAPLVVSPSTLDITTARFGKLEIDLKEAAWLEAKVHLVRLIADRLDMSSGILYSLSLRAEEGEFQDFTIDMLEMSSQENLRFDIRELLDKKALVFIEPALAQVRVIVSQKSLNNFLNAQEVLARLSGSAKKRVAILSALARQDVNFGFTFTSGEVKLEDDNHVRMTMESKLGIGKAGLPVQLTAETKLNLQNGWVNLSDTHLLTGGATVPKDVAAKIVRRINDLSKWGSASDDIHFEFTSLNVFPGDRLELAGTARIKRLRFERATLEQSAADARSSLSNKKNEAGSSASTSTIAPAKE